MNTGLGLFGTLGVVFIVLKLVGTISWSWWWVLLPVYGPVGAIGIVYIILALLWLAYGNIQ